MTLEERIDKLDDRLESLRSDVSEKIDRLGMDITSLFRNGPLTDHEKRLVALESDVNRCPIRDSRKFDEVVKTVQSHTHTLRAAMWVVAAIVGPALAYGVVYVIKYLIN